VERWDELARFLAGKKLPGFNVFVNAATGGVELFSPRATRRRMCWNRARSPPRSRRPGADVAPPRA